MPFPKDPIEEKRAVFRTIEVLIGRTSQAEKRRPDWRISADGSTSIFITFSKDDDLFFDVSEADMAAWAAYSRAYVVFVMGEAKSVLVIPVAVLRDKVLKKASPKEHGNFKLHLGGGSRLYFREARFVDLDDYHNAFDLLR